MELPPFEDRFKLESDLNQPFTQRKIINVYRAAAILGVALDSTLATLGLSVEQWGVLRIIYEHPGVSGADIARFASVTPQAVASMLKRLERAELITRRLPSRGRSLGTHLTPKGDALLRRGEKIAEQIEVQFFATFTTAEIEHFNENLLRCIANLEPKN
jgi:DNA-binding MarR family transcriptional regulator